MLDICPNCGRHISDGDMTGVELPTGQRGCVVHLLSDMNFAPTSACFAYQLDLVGPLTDLGQLPDDHPDFPGDCPQTVSWQTPDGYPVCQQHALEIALGWIEMDPIDVPGAWSIDLPEEE